MILIRAKLIAKPIIEMSVHSGKLFGTHLRSAILDNSKFAMLQLRKKEANYDIWMLKSKVKGLDSLTGWLKNIQFVASSSLIPMKWATSATVIVEYAEINSWNILFL
jgi:hypothetical protein